jgi:transcription-repair coupling factor (superfamily II helicase)
MESFAPVLADRMDLLLDYLPPGGCVLVCDPERIRARAADLVQTSQEFLEASWGTAAAGGDEPIDLGAAVFRPITEVRAAADSLGLPWWTIAPFGTQGPAEEADLSWKGVPVSPAASVAAPSDDEPGGRIAYTVNASPAESYRGDTGKVTADVRSWLRDQWRVVLVTEGHGPAQRLAELLRGEELATRTGDLEARRRRDCPGGDRDAGARFVWPGLRLAVLTESDLAGQRTGARDGQRMPSRRRGGIDPLQLTPGDYIVHEQHGVGRYVEMTSRTVSGATRSTWSSSTRRASAAPGGPAVPAHRPAGRGDQVRRRRVADPASSRRRGLGQDQGRARKAAGNRRQLIRFTRRGPLPRSRVRAGHAVAARAGGRVPVHRDAGPARGHRRGQGGHGEGVPMDRLICGDVGYGKTEIAVRAAFKAVQDGRQAAVLVRPRCWSSSTWPPSVSGTRRSGEGPGHVAVPVRGEVSETLAGLADGTVDVVIGTHRLLSPETRFARLGLVIIDEEQRFGVEHKEYLKRLRTEVDVLAMSATPIPRTLEMGVAGIREMSTILTPPEERHPVLTFVGPYEEKQITAAIRRELLRDGQVFFVHNRVASINKVAARLGS